MWFFVSFLSSAELIHLKLIWIIYWPLKSSEWQFEKCFEFIFHFVDQTVCIVKISIVPKSVRFKTYLLKWFAFEINYRNGSLLTRLTNVPLAIIFPKIKRIELLICLKCEQQRIFYFLKNLQFFIYPFSLVQIQRKIKH